jgi:hypothetical protein
MPNVIFDLYAVMALTRSGVNSVYEQHCNGTANFRFMKAYQVSFWIKNARNINQYWSKKTFFMKITIFWVPMSCNLVQTHRRFAKTYRLRVSMNMRSKNTARGRRRARWTVLMGLAALRSAHSADSCRFGVEIFGLLARLWRTGRHRLFFLSLSDGLKCSWVQSVRHVDRGLTLTFSLRDYRQLAL